MNVKNVGPENYGMNLVATSWVPAVQIATGRTKLYTLTLHNLNAATRYVWVFDAAAGTGATVGPSMVIALATGAHALLEWSAGALFRNGLYLSVSTVKPTDASTAVTAGANNDVIMRADFRLA